MAASTVVGIALLARLSVHLADQPWALRLPSTLAVAPSVHVVTLLTRELGVDRCLHQAPFVASA